MDWPKTVSVVRVMTDFGQSIFGQFVLCVCVLCVVCVVCVVSFLCVGAGYGLWGVGFKVFVCSFLTAFPQDLTPDYPSAGPSFLSLDRPSFGPPSRYPSPGPPFSWKAQNFALCFPSPATKFVLSSLGVFS